MIDAQQLLTGSFKFQNQSCTGSSFVELPVFYISGITQLQAKYKFSYIPLYNLIRPGSKLTIWVPIFVASVC